MLTQARLKELLNYDPDTGIFNWLVARSQQKLGDVAGSITVGGYISIKIDGADYLAHRLAWLYITGKWPENGLDHKNRVSHNNRFTNLREATQSENGQNRKLNRNNASGFHGVSWDTQSNKWRSQIASAGKRTHLGLFEIKEDAALAYSNAKRLLHKFHPEVT